MSDKPPMSRRGRVAPGPSKSDAPPMTVRTKTRVRKQELARILMSGLPPAGPGARVVAQPQIPPMKPISEAPQSLRRGHGAEGPKSLRRNPKATAEEAPKSLRRTPAALPPGVGDRTGRTVLVIDDEEAIRELVVKTLAVENYVYQASDGQIGLEMARKIPSLDVIICDVTMPRLDGLGVVKALKADPELRTVPIILLSARDSAADHVSGIQAGAFFYLTKPFKARDLRMALARAQRRG
jgi:CheY-like chemotaxis protein